jgi:hypothetical protein
MSSKGQQGNNDGEDDDVETSKLGVLVPEHVQEDNRALVLYRNDGSKRNKLGPETTERLTHGLAMYFWRNPSEVDEVAHSEYVDDPEAFKNRIREYQKEHIEDTLVVARKLLHGSHAHSEPGQGNSPPPEPQNQKGESPIVIGAGSKSNNRLGAVPRAEDASPDRAPTQSEREGSREHEREDIKQLVGEEVREQMAVVDRKLQERLTEIENAIHEQEEDQEPETQD